MTGYASTESDRLVLQFRERCLHPREDRAVRLGSVASLTASRQKFYQQFTGACLPWAEFLPKCHVFVGLKVIVLSRAVPLTRRINSDDEARN
jgi:hypothetical protein